MNKNNFKNFLICNDNLKALDDLKKQGIKVDLIYLDPPFFSNRHYEVVWGDEAEVRSFKDRWAGGIHVYIEWMRERIVKMHGVLKDTGSFYLHCDWHASHYLKIMLDDIFGHNNFRNEIIWKRSHAHGGANRYGSNHDVIFFYVKSQDYKWNPVYQQYDPEYLAKHYRHIDDKGRHYKHENPTGAGISKGVTGKPWRGINPTSKGRHWSRTPEELERLDSLGLIYWPAKKGAWPYIKIYLDKQKGYPAQDVWTDINVINMMAKERLGYPTQKPEALLERIIKASSDKNDLILDPFCGCGTAMAVAHKLKRKWIGIDISPTAISLIEKRLEKLGAIKGKDFDSIGMPTTVSALKKLEPFEFQNWVVNEMQAKQSKKLVADKGLNGHIEKSLYSEEAGIQVKQSEKVGRNVVDNFETALERKKYKRGYVVGFSFTKGAHEEVARVREEKGLYIKLVKVEDLLKRKPGLLK